MQQNCYEMESPFIYNKPVTGKNNIGRKQDAQILANLLAQGECISIYEPPRTGKTSLIQQTFFNMKVAGKQFIPVSVSLLNVRTVQGLLLKLGDAVIKGAGRSPEDYPAIVGRHLEGSHFIFDEVAFSDEGRILSLNWDTDDDDIRSIFMLPYRIAAERGLKIVVVIDEFQNVMQTEDGDKICGILHGMLDSLGPEDRIRCSYIFTGSQVNAMKDIFETRRLFYHKVEHLKLSELDSKEIIDHIVRGFLSGGKVLDRNLMLGICKLFRGNIWYIQHFSSICDSLSKGYMMEPVLTEALESLIAIHEPEFVATMNGLTTYQVSLLRAILDGYTKFSSSDVIRKYGLNSSANVRRLKDALCKKEIVTFDENDDPVILDPLFEYWVRRFFFEMKES